ncbi:MAG: efflux RND transporter periplasmic adaptor subunit [Bacteroidia bacterium]|nr:efflux RND transporter periplasmic adaptor subunit [Bacteroidia bacterium]
MLASCRSKEHEGEIRETFPVTHVIKSDTSTFIDYVTEVHAIQNVEMRARVTGYLEKIHVDEGTYVKENQLLFTINNREYLEELAKAKALYKSSIAEMGGAELEFNNVQQLADKKIVSSTELALARNKLDAQKAKMEEALAHQSYIQIRLSNTEIRAPFNGIINRIPHKIGSLIDEGTLLTTISQNDDVFAYFDVSEKEYLSYARNLQSDSVESKVVSLILADGSEHPYKGKIETIEGVIDEKTGTIAFRARFSNPGKIIKHGASGCVRLRKNFKGAILVPQKSTFEIQDKLYVYVVDNSNKVQIRNITIKNRLPHLFIINEGVKVGDKIIYEGIQNVKENMIINPSEINMQTIIKELTSQ